MLSYNASKSNSTTDNGSFAGAFTSAVRNMFASMDTGNTVSFVFAAMSVAVIAGVIGVSIISITGLAVAVLVLAGRLISLLLGKVFQTC